ncbi:type VII secretion integral membrane protein EccD [Mycobacterium sp. DL592]|uniref:type VII secretion integral membrane protein EccD n=1 Tax=Mycobacterium sp. DL592 TaxID=2675524 RepID=UPI00273A2776|nr:type VII secretion integral membrane protein EccD [Mycobacterium sp. DL592]
MTETLVTPVLPVVRVAVLAGHRITEISLPAEVPLREILPAVERLAHTGDDVEQAETAAPARLTLAPIGGAPFSLDASLDTVGVVDGDLLALQPIPAGPAAPGIVEDIADAAVIFSEARKQPWGPDHIRRAASAGTVALVLALTGLAVGYRLASGTPVGGYVLGALAAVVVVASLLLTARARRASLLLSGVALAPITAALALVVPGPFGWSHVLLAAAGFAAWSLLNTIIGEDGLAFFTATTVVGAGLLVASAAAVLWHLPLLTLGAIVIAVALLVTIQAAPLSALWARFPLPVIPAPGDPAPTAPPLQVLKDLPRRVRISEAHQTGFIAGAVLLSVIGSFGVVGLGQPGPWAWYLVLATSAAAVLRARIWDTAADKAWLLAQPALLTLSLLAVFAVQGRYVGALVTVAVLAALVAAWWVVAANPGLADPDSYSLPVRRGLGFVAAGFDASLIPVIVYVVGLFDWVLNR